MLHSVNYNNTGKTVPQSANISPGAHVTVAGEFQSSNNGILQIYILQI